MTLSTIDYRIEDADRAEAIRNEIRREIAEQVDWILQNGSAKARATLAEELDDFETNAHREDAVFPQLIALYIEATDDKMPAAEREHLMYTRAVALIGGLIDSYLDAEASRTADHNTDPCSGPGYVSRVMVRRNGLLIA